MRGLWIDDIFQDGLDFAFDLTLVLNLLLVFFDVFFVKWRHKGRFTICLFFLQSDLFHCRLDLFYLGLVL